MLLVSRYCELLKTATPGLQYEPLFIVFLGSNKFSKICDFILTFFDRFVVSSLFLIVHKSRKVSNANF